MSFQKNATVLPQVLFVQNLNPISTKETFSAFLKQLSPEITSFYIEFPPEWSTQTQKAAFISYDTFEDCCDSFDMLDGFSFLGRRVEATLFPIPSASVLRMVESRKYEKRRQLQGFNAQPIKLGSINTNHYSSSFPTLSTLSKSSPMKIAKRKPAKLEMASSFGSCNSEYMNNPILSHYNSGETFSMDDFVVGSAPSESPSFFELFTPPESPHAKK